VPYTVPFQLQNERGIGFALEGMMHHMVSIPLFQLFCILSLDVLAHTGQDVNFEPNLPVTDNGPGSNTPSTDQSDTIELSEEQKEVVKMCERGDSVFFTGSAGTGKSVCLRHIIRRLRDRYGESVFVTASTGTFPSALELFFSPTFPFTRHCCHQCWRRNPPFLCR
jgi:hypothetical protein